jgi:DNA-binding response OmpR family regulator
MVEPAFPLAPAPAPVLVSVEGVAALIDVTGLSATEAKVWAHLCLNCGETVTTEAIAREALGRTDERAAILVRHCIFRLRALLGSERALLQHRRGSGYRLSPAPAPPNASAK